MRVFLTGGTGFIGAVVARQLRDRGDDVMAYVRNADKAQKLVDMGCEIAVGSIVETPSLTTAMEGADAVIHAAGVYQIGVPPEDRPAMYEGNVTATERVLDAAVAVNASRIVYVSTVGAFGNTEGKVVDETHVHKGRYVSYYDETKHLAHLAAEQRIADGAPVVIVQPGVVYGPGDHSPFAAAVDLFLKGRMPAVAFPEQGVQRRARRGRRGRDRRGARKGNGRRELHTQWRDRHDAAVHRDAGNRGGAKAASVQRTDRTAPRDRSSRPAGGTGDGARAEPVGDDHRRRRRDLLGATRQGDARAGLPAAAAARRVAPDAAG